MLRQRRHCATLTSHFAALHYDVAAMKAKSNLNLLRVVTCSLALLMPLSSITTTRPRGVVHAAGPQSEVTRIAELRPVHEAFAWFQSHANEITKTQIEMVSIPAPPFGE